MGTSTETKKRKRKTKRGNCGRARAPGDPDYLTPTQLRNRRKRRAKEQQRKLREGSKAAQGSGGAGSGKNRGDEDSGPDPSARYISDPANAPAVRAARRYLAPILKSSPAAIASAGQFRVHLGPIRGWRTAAKLAVRPDIDSKVAVGLFLPRSHKILPVPDCIAHHPSINRAVECIVRACRDVGVVPYREGRSQNGRAKLSGGVSQNLAWDTGEGPQIIVSQDRGVRETSGSRGTGQLRYVSVNVERKTGAVQITLVWNGSPPPHANAENGEVHNVQTKKREHDGAVIEDSTLKKLVRRLISAKDEKHSESAENVRPEKRRRRRGRRHDNCEANTSSDVNDRIDGNVIEVKATIERNETLDKKGLGINLHSLWINYNTSWKHSNAIFSHDPLCWQLVHGPYAIVEHLAEQSHTNKKNIRRARVPNYPIPLKFPPNVFRQANLDAFAKIVWRIRDRITEMKNDDDGSRITCVELYGGVGTIGLNLSDIVTSLVSSDENPNNVRCFHESARALLPHVRSSLEYKSKSASDMIKSERALLDECRVLIIDPPRKGLDDEVVNYLCGDEADHSKLELVAYVSCGFNAFQRDCNALLNSGRWEVESAEGHLLFPGSDAIETLAFFVPRRERHGSR